ncbi:hypothetical protein EVJ32_04635 [Exiguobacterium sp. SH5S4]|uniref:hypothetical protein n=1 Tax=Exiguobacterium sp. SH5S4 TaxID=2510961 RepID=UPI00103D06C3|nr:hypothetical protein [Exiguobacterium sp. SH5S4]TCI26664.1 hypothetical protein EVJ32_04635 [Exiguobacterium sp. SH5S4]
MKNLIENELNVTVLHQVETAKNVNKFIVLDETRNEYSLVVRVDEPNERPNNPFKNTLGCSRTYWKAPGKAIVKTVEEFKKEVESGKIILDDQNTALIDVSENAYSKHGEYNNRYEVYYFVRQGGHVVMMYDRIKYKGILEGYGYLEDGVRSKGSTDRVRNVAELEIKDKYNHIGKFNEYGEHASIKETSKETYVHVQDLYIYPHDTEMFDVPCMSLTESTQGDYKNNIIQVNDVISYGVYTELEGFEGE